MERSPPSPRLARTGLAAGLGALLLGACATLPPQPVAVESPVPKAEQVAAQQVRQAPVEKRYKLKVAVARFTNETNYGKSLLSDADLDRIGKQAGDMLASRLVASRQFVVLERPDLGKVEREQLLAGGGKAVGADTVIIGSVTEFGRKTEGKTGFLSSTQTQKAQAKVDVRLVDVKTGHAYFSAIGGGEASSSVGEVAGYGSAASYDGTLNDRAIAAAISDVIDRIVSQLGERPWRAALLEVQGGQLFLGAGARQGVRPGDVLGVWQAGATVRNPQTGFDVSLPPAQVAKVKVLSTFGDSETNEGAVAELLSGNIDRGQLARLFVAEPAP